MCITRNEEKKYNNNNNNAILILCSKIVVCVIIRDAEILFHGKDGELRSATYINDIKYMCYVYTFILFILISHAIFQFYSIQQSTVQSISVEVRNANIIDHRRNRRKN